MDGAAFGESILGPANIIVLWPKLRQDYHVGDSEDYQDFSVRSFFLSQPNEPQPPDPRAPRPHRVSLGNLNAETPPGEAGPPRVNLNPPPTTESAAPEPAPSKAFLGTQAPPWGSLGPPPAVTGSRPVEPAPAPTPVVSPTVKPADPIHEGAPDQSKEASSDKLVPKVELKRLDLVEQTPRKRRDALPSPNELPEDQQNRVTPRGWPPARLSLSESAAASRPEGGVPPSVTGFPPARSAWEGPVSAMERLRSGGADSDNAARAEGWPPAGAEWPPKAEAVVPSPQEVPEGPPDLPTPAPKKTRSKLGTVLSLAVVGGIFTAAVFYPTKKPDSSSSPLAVASPSAVASVADTPSPAPSALVTPSITPSETPSPLASESASPFAAPSASDTASPTPSGDAPSASPSSLPGFEFTPKATPTPTTSPTPVTYSLKVNAEPRDVNLSLSLQGPHQYDIKGSGQIDFSQVLPGSYNLTVKAPGYKLYHGKVEIKGDLSLPVALHKIAKATPKARPVPPRPSPTRAAYQPPVRHDPPPVRHDPPPRHDPPRYNPPPRYVPPPRRDPPRQRHEIPVNL